MAQAPDRKVPGYVNFMLSPTPHLLSHLFTVFSISASPTPSLQTLAVHTPYPSCVVFFPADSPVSQDHAWGGGGVCHLDVADSFWLAEVLRGDRQITVFPHAEALR